MCACVCVSNKVICFSWLLENVLQQVVTRCLTLLTNWPSYSSHVRTCIFWLAFKNIYTWSRWGQAKPLNHKLLNKCNLPISWKSSTLDLTRICFMIFMSSFLDSLVLFQGHFKSRLHFAFSIQNIFVVPFEAVFPFLLTLSYKLAVPSFFPGLHSSKRVLTPSLYSCLWEKVICVRCIAL